MQVAKRTPGKTRSAFVCPDCRSSLHDLTCDCCQVRYEIVEGIPNLLSRDGRFKSARSIGSVYDYIYSHRRSVWEDQGRTPEFIEYFAGVVAARSTGRILEIGCGEGILLARLQAREKLAVDISAKALQLARSRSGAECAAALAERLPFADSEFDAVFSVGVMEHFLDENAACAEIRRVLKPRGAYIALIHTARTRAQELQQKIRKYLFPRPRPLAFAKWLQTKVYRPIHQPIQRSYTLETGRACLRRHGLEVERVISLATDPGAPLVGPHVVIYVARRADPAGVARGIRSGAV